MMSLFPSWPTFATNRPAGNPAECAAKLVAGAVVELECDGRNRGRNANARMKALTNVSGHARRGRRSLPRPGLDGAEVGPTPTLLGARGRIRPGKRGRTKGPLPGSR